MNKPKHFVLLVVLLVASAGSSLAHEPIATFPQISPITSTPLLTSTPKPTVTIKVNPTATEILFGSLECRDKGHSTTSSLERNWLITYVGSKDDNPTAIGMTLVFSGNFVEGVFFYGDEPDEMIIYGCLEKARDFILYGYDENGRRLVVIHGEFPEIDPLGGFNGSELEREVIIGTWVNEITLENYSIYLRLNYAVGGTLEHQYQVAAR